MKDDNLIDPIYFIKKKGNDVIDSIKEITIGELMSVADETIIKGNTINITKVDDKKTLNLKIVLYPNGRLMEKMEVANTEFKKDLIPTVREMKNGDMTQNEIATRLGISQSYVSQLLKKE